jgi:hypothetical protein
VPDFLKNVISGAYRKISGAWWQLVLKFPYMRDAREPTEPPEAEPMKSGKIPHRAT